MKRNEDIVEDTIYGVNSNQQAKINLILKILEIETRKTQNINFIKIDIKINYFNKCGETE